MTDLVELSAYSAWLEVLLKEGKSDAWDGAFNDLGKARIGTTLAICVKPPVRLR